MRVGVLGRLVGAWRRDRGFDFFTVTTVTVPDLRRRKSGFEILTLGEDAAVLAGQIADLGFSLELDNGGRP